MVEKKEDMSAINDNSDTKAFITGLIESLCIGLYEKEEAIKLTLLSTIAGESIFLLGPPGVGKSLIARRLKHAFKDGTSFEYLMSKFSTPDEIFGPVSIKKLKEEDKYERLTDKYLPSANIVFLDEIWKAGPAIQNALLTILNEKIYRNGGEDIKVAIRGIITASNELPPKNTNLAPIWDRFLIRLQVGNIRQFRNFLDMVTDVSDLYKDNIPSDAKLTNHLLDQWSAQIDAVQLPSEVLNVLQIIKIKIEEHNAREANQNNLIIVHDRRWKKIVRLLRTSAFLNGRPFVDLMDCFLMRHCLWSKPDQLDLISNLLTEIIERHGYTMAVNLQTLKKEVFEFEHDVDQEIRIRNRISEDQLMPIDDEYYQLVKDDNRFEGTLIPIKQFQQLTIGESKVVNYFDEQKNLVNRLQTQKSANQHQIEVYYNSERHNYPLKTRQAERTEIILKKPHPIIQKHWDERHHQLMQYIEGQLKEMVDNKPVELDHIEANLFVPKAFSDIVKSNYEQVKESLAKIKLQLEQVQYAYTNL